MSAFDTRCLSAFGGWYAYARLLLTVKRNVVNSLFSC
jgi:hypothetical protein